MKTLALIVAGILALAAAGYGGYRLAQYQGNGNRLATAGSSESSDREVLYWYDPMHPEQRFEKPGKSPFMDMQLVPKYAGEEAQQAGTVSLSPQMVQTLGVRTAQAKRGSLEQRVQAVGSVAWNERGVVQLQARAAGFVERLHARAPLDPVSKGAPLVEILFPEWVGAQEEYLLLRKHDPQLAQAARQRLALLGMSEAEIAVVERDGATRARVTLASPISGVVAELGVREGMTVAPGMTLFKLVDLSTVWVYAEVPEAQATWVTPGSRVQARVQAYPERVFEGRVGALLPEVNAATRTLRARVELANPGALLKPGMFAALEFSRGASREAVLVPSEAVIRTGTRNVVIVALDEGRFRAADVELGHESGGQSEIRKGVQPGDRIVLSGQFLIDSEASLSATVARLADAQPAGHRGRGRVTHVDAKEGEVELDHEAIASLRWPPMTMGFVVENRRELAKLKPGDVVQFELRAKPDKEGEYVIRHIAPEKKK